ncbi:MAG TPA: prolyl oligopeptidase family serine peptidase, partial [Oleiagrimonas sp.]|nr:prolyl oligopeptidase family serine peptidase [Oleiagrimonas sp.]
MKPAYHPLLLCAAIAALCLAFDAGATTLAPAPAASSAKAQAAKTAKHAPMPTFWSGLSMSPHGKHLAWTGYGAKGTQIKVGDAEGKHARTVQMPDAKCRGGRALWSPDGSELAFLSNCGNKNKAQQDVYLVDVDAAKLVARRLTHLDGYVHGLAWAPTGKKLGILYVKGDTHRIGATAASKPRVGVIGVSGVEHQQMAEIDASTGKVKLVTPASLFVYEFSYSPRANRITYIAAPPPGANNWWTAKLYAQNVGSTKPVMLVDAWKATGSLHHLQMAEPHFSPDGKTIAFIGGLMSDQGATGGDIYVVPSTGGQAVNVTPGIHFSPGWFTWTSNHSLLASSIIRAESQVGLFTLDGTRPAEYKALFTTPSALGALSVANDDSRFVFVHSTFNEAPEIYAGELALNAAGQPTGLAQPVHALTHANTDIKPRWGKGVEINWHNEGHDVSGWLLLPEHYDPKKSYPMIVSVHGGPVWAVRARWPFGRLAKFSQKGYFVFMPNPRGSLGQGEAFTKAVRRDMGYGDLRDILAGVDAVEKQYSVDDNRLGLMGWSYGGFM